MGHTTPSGTPNPQGHRAAVGTDEVLEAATEYGEECGGKGGVPYQVFAYRPARICRVTVWHRQYIDGLQLDTDQGPLPRIGGTGMHLDVQQSAFELEPDEFLTAITVEYWQYIDRLTFHTSKRSHGPFGGTGGRLQKHLQAPPGRTVVGFKGRHWEWLDSIQLMVL